MASAAGSLFKNLQPISVGAGCGVEGAWVIELCASAVGLPGAFWCNNRDVFILLERESALVKSEADSNRYTLVLTHMI
jgi:hypothetical protein